MDPERTKEERWQKRIGLKNISNTKQNVEGSIFFLSYPLFCNGDAKTLLSFPVMDKTRNSPFKLNLATESINVLDKQKKNTYWKKS